MSALKLMFWRLLEGAPAEDIVYKARRARAKGGKFLLLARFYQLRMRQKYACYISYKADFGDNLKLPHPVAIVIGDGAVIGDNVTIYQNVTIGAARMGEGEKGLYPSIGNHAVIFAGAKLLGPIRVGENAVVAANAVVLADVPANCVAAGIPATIRPRKSVIGASQAPA